MKKYQAIAVAASMFALAFADRKQAEELSRQMDGEDDEREVGNDSAANQEPTP